MSLGNFALGGVVIVGVLYLIAVLAGMIAAWPWGLVGLIGIAFVGILLGGVIRQRLNDPDDAHYTRNIKD